MVRRLLPASAAPDVRRVVAGRGVRGFADGFVSVLLAQYLSGLGYSPTQVGAVVTGTLVGSAALTLALGVGGRRIPLRTLLLAACALMAATGLGFLAVTWFWPLLAIAAVGTLNPTGGDVSVFLPTEQAFVAGHVAAADRPRLYAVYNVAGTLAGAFGALASGTPEVLAHRYGWDVTTAQRSVFALYALAAIVILALYRRLGRDDEPADGGPEGGAGRAPAPGTKALGASRRIVLELAALFSLDSAGSGFVGTSLLVLWLRLRFDLSGASMASVFFAAGLLGAGSQFLAPRLADRIGLVRTMAFTHLPANALLALAAFAPRAPVAIGLLLVRALFAQMDVPARQSFVMAVVPAEDRAAASSVTNVPRSLAAATTPLLAGLLLRHSTFGWPLLIAGLVKMTYDLALLALYRNVPEEEGAHR